MIALLDYGAGNLTSVRKALATVGADFFTPSQPAELDTVDRIIVPGVGHFDATRALDEQWHQAVRAAVERGTALFGICLGMQWLFEGSDEAPDVPGLGLIHGRCQRLGQAESPGPGALALKIPHVGWNSLESPRQSALMHGVATGAQVYFTHSYVAPVVAEAAALTTYGRPFTAAVERGRIAGVQFHPEKSGEIGLRILRNWLGGSCSRSA